MSIVRTARLAAGLTQAELAARVQMPQSSVARAEAPGANPRLRTLERLLAGSGHRLSAAAETPSSVDESLVAARLRLTPGQRIRSFEASHAATAALRGLARP